jgi:hypothetical protein
MNTAPEDHGPTRETAEGHKRPAAFQNRPLNELDYTSNTNRTIAFQYKMILVERLDAYFVPFFIENAERNEFDNGST